MNWCFFIPLIVGLISALLGYLLGKLLAGQNNNHDECNQRISLLTNERDKFVSLNADLQAQIDKLKADLDACNSKLSTNISMAAAVAPSIPFNAALAATVFGKKVAEDDLKIIEGIGPVIEGMFKDAGIDTWKKLADASVEECQTILNNGGDRFRVHNPGTWPQQAQLAYEGKWESLKKWQDELDGGK
ncbi:MAG: hypothetical protein H6553_10795 [Chitinophagales bacterium]|nr:hypothetical protein [Chitinophagales bacterium]